MEKETIRYLKGRKVTFISILVNTCFIFLKLFAGIFGRSSAIIADAIHSLSDLATDIVVILGLKYSTKASDENHPYGHEKIETLISSILGMALAATFLAFFIIKVGIKITGSTFSELVESSAGKELTGKIREIASLTNGVSGVHRIRARYIGSSIMVELHIEVAGDMKVDEAHFIADEVERKIMENIKQVKEVLVHVDPLPGG